MRCRSLIRCIFSFNLNSRFQVADARIYVDASSETEELEEIEKRYTQELLKEFRSASDDAILLFSEYSSRSGRDLKFFLKNISMLSSDTKNTMNRSLFDNAVCLLKLNIPPPFEVKRGCCRYLDLGTSKTNYNPKKYLHSF